MRGVFLWLARNQWLKTRLPRLWFMRRAVRRFMPGETMEDALRAASRSRLPASERCTRGLARTSRRSTRPRPSPTTTWSSSTRSSPRGSTARFRSSHPARLDLDTDASPAARPARRADRGGGLVPVAGHGGSATPSPRLRCTSASAEHPRTGICLQAYLRRTAADIERLRPLDPAIRLVKGAYDEPEKLRGD